MARHVSIVVTIALLAGLLLSVQAVGAVDLPDNFNGPVDFGIAWLAEHQNKDPVDTEGLGSWGTPPVPTQCSNSRRVEKTALAVLKMLERARELKQAPPAAASAGLAFLLTKVQNDGSIWDAYDLTAGSCPESIPPIIPETSAAIMAFATADSDGVPAPAGISYKQVIQGAVNYLTFAQRAADYPDDLGGWTFADNDATNAIPEQPSDQVNTGAAALALVYAEKKSGIIPDPAVMDRLETWVAMIQDSSGGASYSTREINPDIQHTGALLIEQYLIGYGRSSDPAAPVEKAISHIENEWDTWAFWGFEGSTRRYILTTGLVLMDVGTLNDGQLDWFDALTTQIIDTKKPEGEGMFFWEPETWGDDVLPTAQALLTLEGRMGGLVADDPLPVPIDIKPGSCPNAFNRGDKGVMSVAVVGTSEFDVTKIDPESITLNGVSALRSGYDDVATPYVDTDPANDPMDCTTDEADGFVDLVLKFHHQDIAATLSADIPPKGDAYPLILTGTLKEELGATPITGTDHIWVVE